MVLKDHLCPPKTEDISQLEKDVLGLISFCEGKDVGSWWKEWIEKMQIHKKEISSTEERTKKRFPLVILD